MARKIVAGNWEMNTTIQGGQDLALALAASNTPDDVEVIIAPPATHLTSIQSVIRDSAIKLAGQNCHNASSGAYTGEVSASMLKETGVIYVILGHSERRSYFGEDSTFLLAKLTAVLAEGLHPIFCCGEKLEARENGQAFQVVEEQLTSALFQLTESQLAQCVIAYEPVWAIGTGVTASPAQAQEMHHFIRGLISAHFNSELAKSIPILYGGSVKPNNATEIFSQMDVDGGLVGGASLNAQDFGAIINAYPE